MKEVPCLNISVKTYATGQEPLMENILTALIAIVKTVRVILQLRICFVPVVARVSAARLED